MSRPFFLGSGNPSPFGDLSFPFNPGNPFNLDAEGLGSNAAFDDKCECLYTSPYYSSLDIAVCAYSRQAFLFRDLPLEQYLPQRITSSGCYSAPINSAKHTIKYHSLEDGLLDFHFNEVVEDPSGDNKRINLRQIISDPEILNSDLFERGYEHIYGDQPGYKQGRNIGFEDGKATLGLVDIDKIVKKKSISPVIMTALDGKKYQQFNGLSDIYIKKLVFYYKDLPNFKSEPFHLVFRYSIENNDCTADAFRNQELISHESIVDNIYIVPTKTASKTSSSSGTTLEVATSLEEDKQYVKVDCNYTTADFIELWGYQPTITKVDVYYLEANNFFENVLIGNNPASLVDSRGRLFVFYQDDINFTSLPYTSIECKAPDVPIIVLSSTSSTPTPQTPGIGGFGGSGFGFGYGGGAGAGDAPHVIHYAKPSIDTASSSSSLSPSAPKPPSSSASISSSSSAAEIGAPPAPQNPLISQDTDITGQNAVVLIKWSNGVSILGSGSSSSAIDPNSPPPGVSYSIYRSVVAPDSGFVLIAKDVQTLSYNDSNPNIGEYNYYRIVAVIRDLDGKEIQSGYILTQIFVIKPKKCEKRDCAGCANTGTFKGSVYLNNNTYSVFFSTFEPQALTFQCEPCDATIPGGGFIRILPEAFRKIEPTHLQIGGQTPTFNPVDQGGVDPQIFCLLPGCSDSVSQQCTWSNTFYVPALIFNCARFGCYGQGFEKVLLPMTITLTQSITTNWTLDVYVMSPDCLKMPIFHNANVSVPCIRPGRWTNNLVPGVNGSSTSTAKYSNNACGLYPPKEVNRTCGTISCAMSPDYGRTWFNYRGVIRITNDRMAINPFVTHDKRTDTIHLFYVERDYADANIRTSKFNVAGKDAYLKHLAFRAADFIEKDAFKIFWPLPSSSSAIAVSSSSSTVATNINTLGAKANTNNPTDLFAIQQLLSFSPQGQSIRNRLADVVKYEKSPEISITQEQNSAFIDQQGRLEVVRYAQEYTLYDPPNRLTRLRREKAICGDFTWTVSGVSDPNCACQSIIGSFALELQKSTANYIHAKWTLSVSDDYNYWIMTAKNGMAIFKHKRGIDQCPPIGAYETICSRCAGSIIGTLDVTRLAVFGDGVYINNGDFEASQSNGTDFGVVPLGAFKDQQFLISNNLATTVTLQLSPLSTFTSNALIAVDGGQNGEFIVIEEPSKTVLAPGDTVSFTIRFKPQNRNCLPPDDPKSLRQVAVRIYSNALNVSPYLFHLQGRCSPADPNKNPSNQVINNFAEGSVYSADAIGTVVRSLNGGLTWENTTEGLKTGQWGKAVYDQFTGALYNLYIVDDMVFCRRYPSVLYTNQTDQQHDLEPAWDGLNLIKPGSIELPNPDFGAAIASGTLVGIAASLPQFLGAIKIPSQVLALSEEDLISIATELENEKDPGGLPIYLAGNRQGTIINGFFPYPPEFVFGTNTSVARAKPAGYLTKDGKLRFFYTDMNGNINGGTLSGLHVSLDSKLKGR